MNLLKTLIDEIEKFILDKIKILEEKLDLGQIDKFLNNAGENLNKYLQLDINSIFKEKMKEADKVLSDKMHNALEDIDFKQFKEKKNQIIQKLKDYQTKIDEYDLNSKKNETFRILEDSLVNALFNVIIEAINGTEMGKYITNQMDKIKEVVKEASDYIDENMDQLESKDK